MKTGDKVQFVLTPALCGLIIGTANENGNIQFHVVWMRDGIREEGWVRPIEIRKVKE